jgi:hypothetical protein
MVDGQPHEFVAHPAGAFSAEKTRTLIGYLTKLPETQGKILDGPPCFSRPADASAGVLEHHCKTPMDRRLTTCSEASRCAIFSSATRCECWGIFPATFRTTRRPSTFSMKGNAIYKSLALKHAGRSDARISRAVADGRNDIGWLRWKCCQDFANALLDLREPLRRFELLAAADPSNIEADAMLPMLPGGSAPCWPKTRSDGCKGQSFSDVRRASARRSQPRGECRVFG